MNHTVLVIRHRSRGAATVLAPERHEDACKEAAR